MADSRNDKGKPPQPWPVEPSPGTARPAQPAAPAPKSADPAPMQDRGRIVHDERGNAVWNWVKETGRYCIDSTSAMLKRLDFGDLRIEGQGDESPTTKDPNRDQGGGYDPYNQRVAPKKPKPPAKK